MKKQLAIIVALFGLTGCASQQATVWHPSDSAPFSLRLLVPDVPPSSAQFEYDTEASVTFHYDESGLDDIPSTAAIDYRAKNGTRYINLRFYGRKRSLEILGELPTASDTLRTEVRWKPNDTTVTQVWYVNCIHE